MDDDRILIVCFTDLERDPRVNRQIRFLSERYRVTAAGLADPRVEGVSFIPLDATPKPFLRRATGALRLAARRYEAYYWRRADVRLCLERLRGNDAAVILANDIDTLPVALASAGERTAVWYDAHEYAPLEFEEDLVFRLLHKPYRSYLCNRYIPRASAMMTVCDSISEVYESDTGVRPDVVWNAPDFEELTPSEPDRPGKLIRLVHHGGAQRSRGIEGMISMMRHLDDRFELNLVLVGNDRAYMDELRSLAGDDRRIRFLDPVPMRDLADFLNRFNVGVYILKPTNFNNRHALPNKFFEFVQARLAVAIGPSPEMARLVGRHDLGLVADDFNPESLAKLLSSLDHERLMEYKRNAHAAAATLSADSTRRKLIDTAGRLIAEVR